MTTGRVYMDGRFLNEAEAALPVSDRGFLYGDALFETLRSYSGRPFLLERHMERLYASCHELGISPREDRGEMSMVVEGLASELGGEAYIRIAVTRGSSFGPWPKDVPSQGRTVIVTRRLTAYPAALYERGLRVATSIIVRHAGSPLTAHKTASYLESVLARRAAAEAGADEALILNTAGRVAELACANIFAVTQGELFTPALEEGPLPGVTRQRVLELAGRLGIQTNCGRLSREALISADEAFATSSLLEVCAVREIDGERIGSVIPGPLTSRLSEAYRQEIARACRAPIGAGSDGATPDADSV